MSNDFKSNESAAETTDSEIRVSRTGQPVSCVFTGGTVLGGYLRLEEKLGRGGMGETWKASDLMAKRSVVVKVVPPEISNTEDAMEQVRTNFQRVHTLQHQHICPVFGLIDDPAYGVYVVMKFINGKTLDVYRRDYIAEHGRFSLSEAIRILWDVARALDYSHERKVIHRDVKLQNIMISPEDGVQLIDFGLAGEISSSMPMESETPLEVSGTRTYMAPEQWLGLPQDARTDQYALAVTAYKLFSGHKPFRRDNEAALKECVLNEEPRPIAGIPEYINAALLKALSKKQEDRFDNCRAFIKAMAEKPKKPKEVQQTVLNKVKSLVRKIDRRLLIASGAAAGLLLGLLVFMFSSSPPTGGLTPAAINDSDKVPETTTQSIQETMLAADDNPPEEEMTHTAGGLSPAARNDAASNDDTLTPEEQTEIDDFCAEYGVKAADENGETLLHEAAKSGKIAVAKYLVSKGADIHAKNKYGNTTLDDAKAQQHTAVAEYLESVLEQSRNREIAEEAGAKAPASLALTFTPEEQAEIDHFIAQYGGDAKAADAEGETLLHKAAKSGKIAVVKFLVSQGADIHAKNNWGDFPLLYAARNGHLE
ncbi:MAG: protein kinase, partial [Planctomycetaceae bacterium]|nr:protein kinase [Planctomycetaceae bacterium]